VVIVILCRFDETMALYGEMQERQLRPDSYTLTALLTACERVGKWQQALALFEEATAAGVRPATINYNSLIFTLGKGGQWAQVAFICHTSCQTNRMAGHAEIARPSSKQTCPTLTYIGSTFPASGEGLMLAPPA